jgi:hypothetical protein
LVLLVAIAALAAMACEFGSRTVTEHLTPAYLTDLQGNRYDITFAALEWGFDPDRFSESAGPDARPALIDPEMLSPGDPGYPGELASVHVIGAAVGGDSHAYPIVQISRNEVVDDIVGGSHVTVAY